LNWIPVLENFKRPDEYADGEVSREECLSMHINIAHLGGLYEVARYIRKIAPDCKVDVHYQEGRVEPPVIWTHTMIALINAFPGVYTDFAFVDKSDLALNIHRIINHHGNEKLKERLMFGSDLWLMGFLKDPALFLEEYEYAIKRNCGNTVWKRITNTNPREFLFP
jgi:predicted TIM-barrel fold metal-dependent hydrolase